MMAARERNESTDPTDAHERIDPIPRKLPTEARDSAEPMERIEPAEPMERIEPAELIDRIEPAELIDHSDRAFGASMPSGLARPGTVMSITM